MRISDWSSDVCSSDLRVAAGAPILAEQHVEESCNINPSFFHPRADYLLRVHGMSMKDIGIFDGDLLAVHTTREARSEERRVGKECVSTCRSRWSPDA